MFIVLRGTTFIELLMSSRSKISNMKDFVSPHLQTLRKEYNASTAEYILMKFKVFGDVERYCHECLIYFLSENLN